MREEIQEWNRKVWMLNMADKKLKDNKSKLNKKKIAKIRKLIDEAWIKIWESHPDQHPSAYNIYKELFGDAI